MTTNLIIDFNIVLDVCSYVIYNIMCIIEKNVDKKVISRLKFRYHLYVCIVEWCSCLPKNRLKRIYVYRFLCTCSGKYTNASNNFILNCWFILSTRFEKFLEKYQCGIHLSSQLLKSYENNEH